MDNRFPLPLPARPRLVIFLKAPMLGRCKTRLARDIGYGAINFYRHATKRLVTMLDQPRLWDLTLAVDPVHAVGQGMGDLWPAHIPRMAQSRGDLGQRMGNVFAHPPDGPVIIIGSDTPQLTPADIRRGFDALGSNDAVFGPAEDGGYWLIGLNRRRMAPNLFCNVRWSSATTLADTLASLPQGFRVAYLRAMRDIDEGKDWTHAKNVTRRVQKSSRL